MANYLKDRYSYISAIGPTPEHILTEEEKKNIFNRTLFGCYCGKIFDKDFELRIHKKNSGHYGNRSNNNIKIK